MDHCKGIGSRKTYCNGTGAALKAAMEKWHGMGANETSSGTGKRKVGNCTVSNAWEKHALNARDHMLQLDHIVETVHHANDQSLAYLSTVWQIREDVKHGKPMKAIVANARKAGQKGAQVVVEKTGDTSPNASHPTQGRKEEVQVTVQLEGLKSLEEEDHDPAHSKESFPKVYVYLLGLVLPLCCLIVCLTLYCVLHKALPRALTPTTRAASPSKAPRCIKG
ncbi:unnamed protein product [Trypanosoma congolense IL3000]|uniref:WGS project CAEQ00000000 data, annotated contig 423 n=1 Tax=Trypanosoma congolense (strain IL3000) TaxID=1068625 RepID=F9WFT3_TRYCI|nr:unnamed protein product [Trypanosoma congolense IL3000]